MSAERSARCIGTLAAVPVLSDQPQNNELDPQAPDIIWADMEGSGVEGDGLQMDLTLALALQGIQMECIEGQDDGETDAASQTQGGSPADDSSVVINIPITTEERLTPPDGGFGWVVVAATFLITFLLTGFVKSFGAFRKLVLEEFPHTSSATEAAWITGLIGTVPLLFAPVTGILMNTFGFRAMVFVGGLLCTIGLGVSFFLTSSGFLVGTLGVLMGVGSSFVVTSCVVCTGRYFTEMRPTAMALALSGGCFGTVTLPTALTAVLQAFGLRCTFLVLSCAFSLICVCAFAFGPPEKRFRKEIVEKVAHEPTNEVVNASPEELSAWSKFLKSVSTRLALRFLGDARFLLTVASVFAMTMGNHFLGYAIHQAKTLGVGESTATLLLTYAAVGDLAIRLSYGVLASRSPFPRTAEFTAALTLSAISVGAIPFCTELWHLLVIAVAAGATTGMWTILIPLVLSSNHGSENMSSTFTLVKLFQGCSKLLYQPASAALRSAWGARGVLFFLGVQISLAAVIALILHIVVSVRNRK